MMLLVSTLTSNFFLGIESSVSIDISDGPPSETDSYNEVMSLLENIDGLSVCILIVIIIVY
jgi:hypothetical protein